MPRILGLLEAIAGFCWITFLWLPLAHDLSPYNQAVAGVGEVSLMLWLLVINSQRWNEKADSEVVIQRIEASSIPVQIDF